MATYKTDSHPTTLIELWRKINTSLRDAYERALINEARDNEWQRLTSAEVKMSGN